MQKFYIHLYISSTAHLAGLVIIPNWGQLSPTYDIILPQGLDCPWHESRGDPTSCSRIEPHPLHFHSGPDLKRSCLLFKKYLFIWLLWVLVAACGIFHCGSQTDSQVTTWGLVAPRHVGMLAPWPGTEPVSLALKGRFLTTAALGKFYSSWSLGLATAGLHDRPSLP